MLYQLNYGAILVLLCFHLLLFFFHFFLTWYASLALYSICNILCTCDSIHVTSTEIYLYT